MTINLDELKLQFIGEGKYLNKQELEEFVDFLYQEILFDESEIRNFKAEIAQADDTIEECEERAEALEDALNKKEDAQNNFILKAEAKLEEIDSLIQKLKEA